MPPTKPDPAEQKALVPPRPRQVDQLVGAAFALYGRYPLLFFVLAVGVIVPYHLIVLAITGAGPFSRSTAGVGAQILLALTDLVLVGPLVSALHVHAVAEVREGREPQFGAVGLYGVRALPVVAAATIIATLGIALGLVAFIVPGILLLFRWAVVAQSAAIERDGWLPALRRSRQLTEGNYTHILVFYVYLGAILSVPSFIGGFVFGPHNRSAAAFVIGVTVTVFSASFGALTTALLYFDLRARHGGA